MYFCDTLTNILSMIRFLRFAFVLFVIPMTLWAQTDPLEVTIGATTQYVCAGDSVTLYVAVDASASTNIVVPPVAVGDVLCTDNSIVKISAWPVPGKAAMGIVFYVDNTGLHGWAVHLQDQSQGIAWCTAYNPYIDVAALANVTTLQGAINDLNGFANTQKIRNAGTATTFPAAYAVEFSQGWYIPSMGQLNVLYAEYPKVDEALLTVGGTHLFPFNNDFCEYWSSSEYSDYGVWCLARMGYVRVDGKLSAVMCLRSIRNF